MATTTTATQLDHNAVKVRSTTGLGGTPTAYLYVDGRLMAADKFPFERVVTLFPGQSALIEVLDTTDAPAEAYSGQVLLQWGRVDLAERYFVQYWDGAAWQTKRVVVSQGDEVLEHLTQWLNDEAEYQFRVLPVSADNIQGTPLQFLFIVVRRPDAPESEIEYDPITQRVTVSAV